MKNQNAFESLPSLVASDEEGNIFDVPELKMAGASGLAIIAPESDSLVPMPAGSTLYLLPGRTPIGLNPKTGKEVALETWQGKRLFAVAAFMAPAYTQTLRAAWRTGSRAPVLPLYAYTAVGWRKERFYAAGVRTDKDTRHDPDLFNDAKVNRGAEKLLSRFPGNRVVRHLVENCIRRYGCLNAKNLAMGRFEAPAPVSPGCNARCAGCLSLRHGTKAPCPQERIAFVPDPGEIIAYGIPHLENADRAMLSFGQGCEGEPLTQFELVLETIGQIRKKTSAGTLQMNTNGSKPALLEKLFDAGLDSIRVSLNSAQEKFYLRHFNPVSYSFADVAKSVRLAHGKRKFCSINYFIFPGFTDNPEETRAFVSFLRENRPDCVQLRNLNLDPDTYIKVLGNEAFAGKGIGIMNWMRTVKKQCPWIRFGYYNPPREEWKAKITRD